MASTSQPQQYDFSSVPAGAIREVHRQGEICLQSTVQLALAADQRATTLTGILGAASVALLVATAAMISNIHPNWALVCAAAITAVLLFIGALFCARATQPVDFFIAGYEPKRMASVAQDETWILRYAAEDVQARIDANRDSLVRASWWLIWGRRIALLGVLSGLMVFSALYFLGRLHFSETGRLARAEEVGSLAELAQDCGRAELAQPARVGSAY
jgi:hypothetical protein